MRNLLTEYTRRMEVTRQLSNRQRWGPNREGGRIHLLRRSFVSPDDLSLSVADTQRTVVETIAGDLRVAQNPTFVLSGHGVNEHKSTIQDDWNAATQILVVDGNTVRFATEALQGSVMIAATSSVQDVIITKGSILRQALTQNNTETGADLETARDARRFIKLMDEGDTVEIAVDPETGESRTWRFLSINHAAGADFHDAALALMIRNFSLAGQDFVLVNFSEDTTFVAIKADEYDKIKRGVEATQQILRILDSGDLGSAANIQAVVRALGDGANMRYIDPESAEAGDDLFARLLKLEAYEILAAVNDRFLLNPEKQGGETPEP